MAAGPCTPLSGVKAARGPELDEWIYAKLDKPQVIALGPVTCSLFAALLSAGSEGTSGRLIALPKPVASSNTRLVAGNAVETLAHFRGPHASRPVQADVLAPAQPRR